ncbi:hypothetical protein phytr_710 [Candidatus Phycorickettsia trachydisci]|uniref:Uncharacterized protein n=1 Tax=Candidatus Phycorickettsia trachydisci TaxID=2115978 RepID=A0A2P1P6Y0_9RICK|nr:ankyrin repeat domain-containing protein [Candidatus Phycorickettsia trachydisci]AVP87034.1 hypothetical protein phytr_710 [Candidatus Phycorickettsia trachydisci]
MTTLESLLNEIIQEINETTIRLAKEVNKSINLYNEALNGSEEETREADTRLKKAEEDYANASVNCVIEVSKKYSDHLVDAIKSANSQGSDTNPIYSGAIEQSKGVSILHLAASGYFAGVIEEILPYIRPQDIKRGSGLKLESELMIAIEEENTTLRDWLLENDTDLMYKKASGASALHISCMVKDYETTERLIKRVAQEKGIEAAKEFVNDQDKHGCIPLYEALVVGQKHSIDNHKMLKFLDLFIEKGFDFNQELSLTDQFKCMSFNFLFHSCTLDSDLVVLTVVKMLNSGQDIAIYLKDPCVREFFINESNIQKMFLLEVYDTPQKSLALNKIKKALIDFSNQNHHLEEAKYKASIELIDQQLARLSEINLIESNVSVNEVALGIEHLDIASNQNQPGLLGHSNEEEVTES